MNKGLVFLPRLLLININVMDERIVVERFDRNKYDDLYSEVVSIISDSDDLNDFKDMYENSPDNIFLAFNGGFLVGVTWFTIPADGETVVGVWVKKRYRNRGYGKLLLKALDEKISKSVNDEPIVAFAFSDNGKKDSSLINSVGFKHSHSYITMLFEPTLSKEFSSEVEIVNYSDEYYEQMVDLRNEGIKEAGKYYGEKTQDLFFKDDKEYRKYMKSVSKNAFMIVNNGILDGFVMVRGTEIMALNVRKNKRGEGYAKALVCKCIDHLNKSSNSEDIYLICVDKNIPAYNLYKKLGFRSVGNVRCYKKEY